MFGRTEASSPEVERVSAAELQDALLRFEGRLSASLSHVFLPFASSRDASVRIRAARDHLLYAASALDIASGPVPEANLFDMVVFIELVKDACRGRWNADLYGERGAAIVMAFEAAAADVWRMARRLVDSEQETELRHIIGEWQRENPEVVTVAAVRLPAFASDGGAAATGIEARASGLFSIVRKGVGAADMARLLGERTLFVAQRMPFLLRLQARLAVREILEDVTADLPSRVRELTDSAAPHLWGSLRRTLVAGTLAAAGVAVAAALAYAASKPRSRS